jgi:hypothetical protein
VAAETLDETLQALDHKLNQLRREYDQYFLGSRPREPAVLRAEVQKIVAILSNQSIQNTGLRFKFSSICSRFQAFKRQWEETLRKIEAGTYERHQFKAKIHKRSGGEARGTGAPERRKQGESDLFEVYKDAKLACGQDVQGLTRDKLESVVEKQRAQLRAKFGENANFRFRVSVEQGKVRLKATREPT